ncbi:MAG TPA: MATE family efflux transporter [Polyangiaceae bacterium]|nr:MATE family efflux transporter [Polyangiaceae bacterium]
MTAESAHAVLPRRTLFWALLDLSWPIVLARATQSVIGFSDALFVAPLGEAPLAAVTTGSLNAFSAIILPMGTVFIVQSFVAQLRGRGELGTAARYAWYGLILAVMAAAASALAIPFVPGLLERFHYADAVHHGMSDYLQIRLLSVGAAIGTEALGNWYGGLGNTRPAMVAAVSAMLANVVGCFVLVQPRFGLPGYGVKGSAWASVAASVLGFLVIAVPFFLRERKDVALQLRALGTAEFMRFLRFGLPNGLNWFLEFGAFALFINVVVGHLGTTTLAAFNVVMQLNSVSFMPAFGLASGGAILVGEAIGRGAHREVWPIVRLGTLVAGAWMSTIGIVYATMPAPLMDWFHPRGVAADALVHTGATMLGFAAFWQLFDAVNMTMGEALRAAGDTVWCMAARIVLAWVVFTPAAWTAVFFFGGGVDAVMISLLVYVGSLGVVLSLRFASGKWKSIDLVGASSESPR